jgi:microcystin-dependent protein
MIVWGGYDGQITRNDGGRYSPTSQMAASAVSNRNLADAAVTGAKIAEATITSDRLAPGIATPPGAVMAFAGTAAPTGWLLCNGNAVSRTTYATLFAAIGTTYGAGDGSTTFNLPDLLGRTIIGAGQGASLSNRTLAQKMGAETHTLSVSEMPSHTHGINDPGHSHTYARTVSGSSFGDNSTNQTTATTATSSSTTGITIQSAGGGAPHNNMQPSLVLNYIIKL